MDNVSKEIKEYETVKTLLSEAGALERAVTYRDKKIKPLFLQLKNKVAAMAAQVKELTKEGANWKSSFTKAFEIANKKIQEYPHCNLLIYTVANVLNAALTLSDLNDEERAEYNTVIIEWLERTADSQDERVRNSSVFMLAGKYVQMEKYEEANVFLNKIPDTVIDATIMKTSVLAHQEETDTAALFLKGKLLRLQIT